MTLRGSTSAVRRMGFSKAGIYRGENKRKLKRGDVEDLRGVTRKHVSSLTPMVCQLSREGLYEKKKRTDTY